MISRLTLVVYKDDLFIVEKYKADIIYVKQFLQVQFKVKDLEEVYIILGI